jgi:hypothetical protein
MLVAGGYAATLFAFYPGYQTTDASFVYRFAQQWIFGDWQSPLMSILWWAIDPVAPGSGSMFLLIASVYWCAFGLLALALTSRSVALGLALPLLALVPPAFMMLAMIWRDVLFAVVWLLAAAIAYAATERPATIRRLLQTISLVLIGVGVLLRPNAAIAAALLAAYALWPMRFEWKRTAIAFVPAVVTGVVLVQVVYYGVFHAAREHPEHSLMVFDLGGITRFTGENQFPVTWSGPQTALLTTACYSPDRWDTYWTIPPCDFVMKRLEDPGDTIFGTPRLTRAWVHAIATHPLAYLRHRLTFFWRFLWGENLTLELFDLDDPRNAAVARNPWFRSVLAMHDALRPTPLFRTGPWLILAAAIALLGWRKRMTSSGVFAIGVCGSGVVYVTTFLLVGVAADFRYGYWCVLAVLSGGATALATRRP